MKKRLASLTPVAVIALVLAGLVGSVAFACTFIGYVGQPAAFSDTHYQVVRSWLPYTACRDYNLPDYAGWSFLSYPSNPASPAQIWRVSDNLAFPDSALIDPPVNGNCAVNAIYSGLDGIPALAAANQPTVVIAHVRESGHQPTLPNPHPWVYPNLFGKTWAYIHNGSVYVQDLQNQMDAGFMALPIFRGRMYNGYQYDANHVNIHAIDSEWLSMAYIKFLMVRKNYYYGTPDNPPGTVVSEMDWAMRRVAQTVNIGSNGNTAINGILTDGETIDAICKTDGGGVRSVYYLNQTMAAGVALIASGYSPTGFSTLPSGYILESNGTPAGQITHELTTGMVDPQELRVNPRGSSAGNQWQPAISADPVSGTFVAVWMSNGQVMARDYNEMGLSESNPFVVSTDPYNPKGSPAIAHSSDGQTITIVWLEGHHEPIPITSFGFGFTMLKKRTYTWAEADHAWVPVGDPALVKSFCCGCPEEMYIGSIHQLTHPTIAYGGAQGYTIAWEQVVCPVSSGIGAIHIIGYTGNTIVIPELTVEADGNDHEPDLLYLGVVDDGDVFALGYHGSVETLVCPKAVLFRWQTMPHLGTVSTLTANGQFVALARGTDATHFYAAFNDGHIRVANCEVSGSLISVQGVPVTGEDVNTDSRVDIATRVNGSAFTPYVCYDKNMGASSYDIRVARIDNGTTWTLETGTANVYTTNAQQTPAMAIANGYPAGDSWYWNNCQSTGKAFEDRRLILWQSMGQDTSMNDWGIVGQFRGIYNNELASWTRQEGVPGVITTLVDLVDIPMVITDPVIYMDSDVRITPTGSLTFAPGVEILVTIGRKMLVEGTLVADNGCRFAAEVPGSMWGGITVTGNASFTGCTIEDATTAIESQKAENLLVDGCTIQRNGLGIYVYAPAGTSAPLIKNCTIVENEAEGVHLFCTAAAQIENCPLIGNNGADGILLTDAMATINGNYFNRNAGFGVNCYGSSPVLYCNDFENNQAGELLLMKGCFPVLWEDKDQKGGANHFLNDAQTLVILVDSDILLQEGRNNFYAGPGAYFMADQSGAPAFPHKLDGNYWSPDIDLSLFNPPDPNLWAWGSVADPGECGELLLPLTGIAAELFKQGYDAEMAGQNLTAATIYRQLITLYHSEEEWAPLAATRMYENQLIIGSGFEELRLFYENVIATFPDDESLLQVVKDLATKLWVENGQYAPAYSTYLQIMNNPPSAPDSAFAAVDFAVTALRQEYENPAGGSLDGAVASVTVTDVKRILQRANNSRPALPQTSHAGYVLPPADFVLDAAYPNPFNPTTTIGYHLPVSAVVRIGVFNVMGQQVATLVDGPVQAGSHQVMWNASGVASGLYLYRMEAAGHTLTQKMLLMK